MDARKHFLVALLSLVMFLAAVQADCDPSLPLGDPYPGETMVNVTNEAFITQIKLEENYPTPDQKSFWIAVFNCDAIEEPTIQNFQSGSATSLGLETETDGSRWYLAVTNAQDYENINQRLYRFTVLAGTGQYEVVLNIVNVDDETPMFLLPDPTPCEIKETLIGQSSCYLTAKDADAIMNNMTFRVLDGGSKTENISLRVVNDKDLCKPANPKDCLTVALYAEIQLEYIIRPVYSLLLEVEDQAGHIGNLSYVVQVEAENKDIPHFTPQQLEIYIDEEKPGLIETNDTTRITVSDRDALEYGQFDLTLDGDGSDDCYRAFDVIPRAGYRTAEVKLSVIDPKKLDYDEGSCNDIIVKIKAIEITDKNRTGEAEVNVKLRDLNDETPIFEQEEYQFSVPERSPIGTKLGPVKANDRDAFDKVTYSLASTTYLKVDPDTGLITVNAEFFYGRQQQIFTTVKAEDTAIPPHSNYSQIVVNVTDINDMRPLLIMPWNPPNIDEVAEVGTVLNVTITAFDEDTDPDLSFSIDWENSRAVKQGFPVKKADFEDCLTIETVKVPEKPNDAEAVLKINKEIHWEVFDTLYVNIIVDDKNTDPDYQENRNASAILTVVINDINDCYPQFSEIRNLTFKENTEKGQLFGIILATDQDGPGFNEVKYYLINDLYEEEYVTIHNTSGEMRTGKDPVDFEEIEVLYYTVVATDGELETPLNITIEIEDVNDNVPYFIGDYSKAVEIPENSTDRISLKNFTAGDDDKSPEFNTLRFFLENQYRGTFEIDTVTGEMYVPEGGGTKLDYEDVNVFSIEITVRDRCQNDGCYFDSLSNSTKITVKLIDINDNPPVIQNGGLLCSWAEDAGTPGVHLGYVIATDLDSGVNADLTFQFDGFEPEEGQELFTITKVQERLATPQEQRASIRVKSKLLDKWGDYTLKVKASDPDFSDIADFIISVGDVNNNEPVFVFPNETTVLRFNIYDNGPGKVLSDVNGNKMVFSAIDDKDRGLNGTAGMTYFVIGDDTAKTYLEMRRNELWLVQNFDAEMDKNFKLQLKACDGEFESNQVCTEIEIQVRMRLNQEFEPTFDKPEWETSFTENKTGLNEVRIITAPVTDLNNLEDCQETEDDCMMDSIYYFIFNQENDFFQLDKYTAELSLKQELDREEKDMHNIIVCITNFVDGPQGLPAENSKLNITIYVNDTYDTAPTFNKSLFAAGININDKTDSEVTTLVATFYDLNDKLTYSINESSMTVTDNSLQNLVGKKPFKIDGDKVRLNFDVQDASMKGMFVFNVQVTSLGNFTDDAVCQVYIISENNLVTMSFSNNFSFVDSKKREIADVYSSVLKCQSNVKNVARSVSSNGELMEDQTDVTSYFVDDKEQKPINKEDITMQLTNKQTYNELLSALHALGLDLHSIEDNTNTPVTSMEGVLQTVLIVVSVVLGTLVIVLFAAFFIRTRSLNRRLEALSTTKFGSQDSGLNRIGMAVPNTNQHAIEGSNPIWNNEEIVQRNLDNVSISSGDSDLIGVEENPEFSPYSNSGVANDGFTPESAEGRRMSVNPMFATGVRQLSASALQENPTIGRSVNPLAEMQYRDGYDSENGSRRSSEIVAGQNNNFTFYGRMDSVPTTQL